MRRQGSTNRECAGVCQGAVLPVAVPEPRTGAFPAPAGAPGCIVSPVQKAVRMPATVQDALLDSPVAVLSRHLPPALAVRIVNTLENNGVPTIRMLLSLRRSDLLAVPNFGVTSLGHVVAALAKLGFRPATKKVIPHSRLERLRVYLVQFRVVGVKPFDGSD